MDLKESLLKKIKKRRAIIGVIGLGYVGLPIALEFSKVGFNVLGFDIDEIKIDKLNDSKSYIKYISSDTIGTFLANKKFRATTDFSKLSSMDAILICVPTPLGEYREPDLSFLLNTATTISKYLQKGQLVVLESTTYPGTTEEELLPILESSKLQVGEDFFLAYSPEREDPGNKDFTTSEIPKVVSGVTSNCLHLADLLYKQVLIKTVPVSSPKVAEATKLLENIYRSVNIALVNELKTIFDRMEINIWEVIEAASTKPFGFTPFYPGPGLGGHCIPIDPFYLAWKSKQYEVPTRFIELSGEINSNMPYYVLSKISEGLNRIRKSINGSNVLILGIAYKKDVDDTRESPSLKIISLLREIGANVEYNDPYVPFLSGLRHYPGLKLESVALDKESLKRFDCTVIVTDHSCYDWQEVVSSSRIVIDTRNATKFVKAGREKITQA